MPELLIAVVLLAPPTLPLPLALVPPIGVEELALELGLVLLVLIPLVVSGVLVVAGVLIPVVVLGALVALLPVLPTAPVPVPVPLVPVAAPAVMLYFCSSSETRELSAESCCRTASTSVVVGVAVVVALAAVDESVEVLAMGAPGAGVVVTT
jgi:hypothetical protein